MSKPNAKGKNGYGTIEREVMCMPELTIFAKGVYCLLVSYAGSKDTCYPSLNTIVKNLGVSKPTIIKAIAELEKHNLVEVQRGINQHNVYSPLNFSKSASKSDLPLKPIEPLVKTPTEEPLPVEVVKEVDQVVNEVNHPSKGGLLGVVKEVDPKNNSLRITVKNNIEEPIIEELDAEASFEIIEETTTIPLIALEEETEEKATHTKGAGKKTTDACYTPCKEFYLQEFPGYYFLPKDGKALKVILDSIRHKVRMKNKEEPTESQITGAFQFVIKNLPAWYIETGNTNLTTISGSFEKIYNQLKNGTSKTKYSTNTNKAASGINLDALAEYMRN